MEYVTNTVLIRICNLRRHPKTIFLLQAALNLSSANILPSIWKIVTFILDKLDELHSVAALPFIHVLMVVVRKVGQWHAAVVLAVADAVTDPIEDAVKCSEEGHIVPLAVTDPGKDDQATETPEEKPLLDVVDDDEVEPEVPLYVTYTVEVS